MGDTSGTGGTAHALERCYRERTETEVAGRLPAELLPDWGASRTIQHGEEDSPQGVRAVRGGGSERLSRALPPTPELPVADGCRDRGGAGRATQGAPALGPSKTTRPDATKGRPAEQC